MSCSIAYSRIKLQEFNLQDFELSTQVQKTYFWIAGLQGFKVTPTNLMKITYAKR